MAISCLPCKKSFKSSQDIHKHLKSTVHGNGLKCDGCLQATLSRWNEAALRAHVEQNHLLYCNECGKSFTTKPDLNQHMKNDPIHAKTAAQPFVGSGSSAPRISMNAATKTSGQVPAVNSAIGPNSNSVLENSNWNIPAFEPTAIPIPYDLLPPINAPNLSRGFPWTTITVSQEAQALEDLSKHCHPAKELKRFNYRLTPYTALEIDGLLKCEKCASMS